jgi:hypothetical protein
MVVPDIILAGMAARLKAWQSFRFRFPAPLAGVNRMAIGCTIAGSC